jgi:topoisomerase IV subunit A
MAYLDTIFQQNYIQFASYAVKERAIPDIDDGLKPVQRRILHALAEVDDGKFHKVANIVGQTMQYHPHGDQSIYGALVVLANKDLLIDKQGNFGNTYTGDPAAAARYIECRLTPLAREALLNRDLTEYVDSYDGRRREPVVFPAKIPVLLSMGAEGIAVGMATKILPHNFIELLEAQVAYLQDKPFTLFPDFPTRGLMDTAEYDDGNGKVLVRARLDTSDPKRIVVRDIPYGTTTERLIGSIEDAARKNKVKVSTISDYTAEEVEIEIKLPRGVYVDEVVDALYAFTDCELSISTNLLVIRDQRPEVLSVTEVLHHNVDRLVDTLTAELRFEEKKLGDRLHAKTLEQIFIENRIYKAIEEMNTSAKVQEAVHGGLLPFADKIGRPVNDEDIDTLLKIPIRRISLYDINRAEKEMREIGQRLKQIAKDLKQIIPFSIAYLQSMIERYSKQFPRRTEMVSFQKVDVREAAIRDLKLCYDRQSGYLGHQVQGKKIADVSHYDRVLIIRRDATYSVVDAPDKVFVGKGMLHCGLVDKEQVFNLIFRDKNGNTLIKRCRVEQFILDRLYELLPTGAKLIKFTTDSDQRIVLDYVPKPRVRVLREEFSITDFAVRGLKAGGIRLSTKEVDAFKLIAEAGTIASTI